MKLITAIVRPEKLDELIPVDSALRVRTGERDRAAV